MSTTYSDDDESAPIDSESTSDTSLLVLLFFLKKNIFSFKINMYFDKM